MLNAPTHTRASIRIPSSTGTFSSMVPTGVLQRHGPTTACLTFITLPMWYPSRPAFNTPRHRRETPLLTCCWSLFGMNVPTQRWSAEPAPTPICFTIADATRQNEERRHPKCQYHGRKSCGPHGNQNQKDGKPSLLPAGRSDELLRSRRGLASDHNHFPLDRKSVV